MMARSIRRVKPRSRLYVLRYRIGEYSLRGFIALLPYIPFRLVEIFASFLAWTTYTVSRGYRQRMEDNLTAALGKEIPRAEDRKALVKRAWLNFALGVLDTAAVTHYSKQDIIDRVKIEGEEHIRRALEMGRGVVGISAHLGQFTMIGARLAASGYPFSVVVKHPADERFARLTDDYRTQLGLHTIPAKPRREAVRGILKALRENRIVMIIADEFKSGDVMVDFFGMKLPAPRGPATMAIRTGAVTLPMFATVQPDDSILLSVGAPIPAVEQEELEDSVVATTARYTACLEAAIRRNPDQWNWLGLPNRNGTISRAELARISRASKKARAAEAHAAAKKTGT
jgi:KDO2-lipid IV(A) lauroyltransferase